MQQAAFRPLHVDAIGAAVAAPRDQLVLQVVDLVAVGVLIAPRAFGDQADAGVLVAHVAFGRIGVLFLIVGQVVRAQVLVPADEGDVALVFQVLLGTAELVAHDVGVLVRAGGAGLFGVGAGRGLRRSLEGRDRILDRAQRPALGLFVRRQRRQAQGDTERQGQQAKDWTHAVPGSGTVRFRNGG